MNREPVNPDDPQMTAYALGELSLSEAAEFEARLQDSPKARRDLDSMREVMDLLSEGLREEWRTECEGPVLKLLKPAPGSTVVVEGNFRPVRRSYAAAAAVVGALLVASVAATGWKSGLFDKTSDAAPLVAEVMEVVDEPGVALAASVAPHVPQLFLAEEIEDPSSLDLVAGESHAVPGIDSSYLEHDAVIPASFQPGQSAVRAPFPDRGQAFDRVDSYLPPMGGLSLRRNNPTTGMIERRLGREKGGATVGSSVLVSGYVTMDGASPSPRFAGGFRPVSISGNPVVNEESDLRLLADLNRLQKDLSEVIEAMPEDATTRSDLERILERSQRVVSRLKSEAAQYR